MTILLLAEGFEEIEAITTVDFLRRCDIPVQTVSVTNGGKTVTGAHGIPVVCDLEMWDVRPDDVTCVILPGGMPGTRNLGDSTWVTDLVQAACGRGDWVAAICAAPSVLGKLGLLRNKNATCYPGFERELTGAIMTTEKAVRDGNIITANGTAAL